MKTMKNKQRNEAKKETELLFPNPSPVDYTGIKQGTTVIYTHNLNTKKQFFKVYGNMPVYNNLLTDGYKSITLSQIDRICNQLKEWLLKRVEK